MTRAIRAIAVGLMVCLSACGEGEQADDSDTPKPEVEIDPQCEQLCETQRDCAPVPLENCEAECSRILVVAGMLTDEGYAGCEDAARMAVECQEPICEDWPKALAVDGPCADTLLAQDQACGSWLFFPGWDVCVAYCDIAVEVCADPQYLGDWRHCWGQCKLNSSFDAIAECGDVGYELRGCIAQFESCADYATFWTDDPNNECFELSEEWEQTCLF